MFFINFNKKHTKCFYICGVVCLQTRDSGWLNDGKVVWLTIKPGGRNEQSVVSGFHLMSLA